MDTLPGDTIVHVQKEASVGAQERENPDSQNKGRNSYKISKKY